MNSTIDYQNQKRFISSINNRFFSYHYFNLLYYDLLIALNIKIFNVNFLSFDNVSHNLYLFSIIKDNDM